MSKIKEIKDYCTQNSYKLVENYSFDDMWYCVLNLNGIIATGQNKDINIAQEIACNIIWKELCRQTTTQMDMIEQKLDEILSLLKP